MPTTRLDAAYNAQINAIRTRIGDFLVTRFNSAQFRTADMERFIKQVVPIVLASRRQVSALTDAYLAQVLSQSLGTHVPTLGPIDTNALRGVPATEVYQRPFQTVWTKLASGMPFDAAVSAGTSRLSDILLTDLQMAKTYTSQNVLSNAPDGIIGYERVPSGNSCALCLIASTQRYHRSDLMPIHPGCNCGVEPLAAGTRLYPALDGSVRVTDPTRLENIHQVVENYSGFSSRDARSPDYRQLIVTHDHGEIGPVLGVRGQNFTGPSAIK